MNLLVTCKRAFLKENTCTVTCCVTFFTLKNMEINFITSHVPNSKFKLHGTCKFSRIYELQYTQCFFWAKAAQVYFENHFRAQELNWNEMYRLSWKVSLNRNIRSFKYKVLKNVLYLNKKCFIFGKSPSFLCSFCKQVDETILLLFRECSIMKELRKRQDLFFRSHLPQLLPQTDFFWGFFSTYFNYLILENHILLLFKIYLYNSRKQEKVTLRKLIRIISKVQDIEKESSRNDDTVKRLCCTRKNGKNVCFFLNIILQMIQKGGGWSFEFCIFAYISYIYFLIFPLYLFFHFNFIFIISI